MERLSDERLLQLRGVPTAQPWSEVREMIDELLDLRAKLAAYKQLDAAQCAQLTSYRVEDRRDHAARATLDSEREANRLLTEENERLRAKLAAGPVMPELPSEEDFMRCFDEMGLIDGSPTGNLVDDCKEAFELGWRYALEQSR